MTSLPQSLTTIQDGSPLLGDVHPLADLPAAALEALAARMQTAALEAGQPLRAAWGGLDALAFTLDTPVEWVGPTPGRAAAPARNAGPRRAFLVRGMDEEGPNPRIARALTDGRIAWVSLEDARGTALAHPELGARLDRLERRDALACMHTVLGTLDDPLLDDLETAADWFSLRRGEVLFEAGSRSDGLYFVIAGRLKAVQADRDGRERVVGSISPGEPAGEVAFFTGGLRTSRVVAARSSLVVQLTDAEFDALAGRRPQLARAVARSVVERVHNTGQQSSLSTATVVLIPAGERLPDGVAASLTEALGAFGTVRHLDRAGADARLGGGMSAPEGTSEGQRADAWLEAAEAAHRFLVLEAEPAPTEWTLRCLRQADRVLVVADAGASPAPGPVEALLDPARGLTEASVALMLLHPASTELPCGTRAWLEPRPWVSGHHHVRIGDPAPGGVSRVARALADRSVGVVLGGGGARGFAHIGILKALTECGVPVDRIGGTSMGGSMGAQWAMGWTPEMMLERNRHMWIVMAPHKVLTLPIVSIVSTRKAQACGKALYGDYELEDLWIPYFCVSSSLTNAAPVVHRTGSLLDAVTATASLPGFAPPVLIKGELLVDGALLNNVPADVMRSDGAGVVIAAEVSPENEAVFTCDQVPTPWEALRQRWRGGRRFPSILEVMMRASMLHSIGRERDIANVVDLFLHPPVDNFPMMDFRILDAVAAEGERYTREVVTAWLQEHPEHRLA
jgi:predicted acylesterase/phospholipase RssA/CRP-like cAMP-binding protein